MLYVLKHSESPILAGAMLYVGGRNNIAPKKGAYLVLRDVTVIRRDGKWDYIFEFDARESLNKSPLAQMTHTGANRYPDSADWKTFLGEDWQVIDEHVRSEILRLAPEDPSVSGVISNLRELPAHDPLNRRSRNGRALPGPTQHRLSA
jgi:hypothetical protein